MDYIENLNNLLKMTMYKEDEEKITLKFNNEYKLFPFQTREPERPKFDSGFKKIISEFSRMICSESIEKEFNNNTLIEEILKNKNIDTKNEEDLIYLNSLIKDYIIDKDSELKIVHPSIYKYVSKTKDISNKGERDLAQFFKDVYFYDDEKIKNYFLYDKDKECSNNHILTSLVIDNLPELEKESQSRIYIPKLKYITEIFKEDMEFAFKNEDFLNKNIENIFAYYYFFYNTQLSLKIFKEVNTLDTCEDIYYLLESENASKNRKTIEKGFKLIKDSNKTLLYKVYTLDYVNKILGTKGYVLSEVLDYYNNLSKNEQEEVVNVLIDFINKYNKTTDNKEKVEEDNFKDLIYYLYKKFLEIKDQSPSSRYSRYFEDVGTKYFLKRGGRYGNILILSQDMLLTITTLCVKEDKIKLKELFERYKERGIYFDNSSKKEVESLLTKLNYIDKKSDSGEAQYVRKLL